MIQSFRSHAVCLFCDSIASEMNCLWDPTRKECFVFLFEGNEVGGFNNSAFIEASRLNCLDSLRKTVTEGIQKRKAILRMSTEVIDRLEAVGMIIKRIRHIQTEGLDNVTDRAYIRGLESAIAIINAIADSKSKPVEASPVQAKSMSLQEIVEESQGQYSLHWKAIRSLAEQLLKLKTKKVQKKVLDTSEDWSKFRRMQKIAEMLASEFDCLYSFKGDMVVFTRRGYLVLSMNQSCLADNEETREQLKKGIASIGQLYVQVDMNNFAQGLAQEIGCEWRFDQAAQAIIFSCDGFDLHSVRLKWFNSKTSEDMDNFRNETKERISNSLIEHRRVAVDSKEKLTWSGPAAVRRDDDSVTKAVWDFCQSVASETNCTFEDTGRNVYKFFFGSRREVAGFTRQIFEKALKTDDLTNFRGQMLFCIKKGIANLERPVP